MRKRPRRNNLGQILTWIFRFSNTRYGNLKCDVYSQPEVVFGCLLRLSVHRTRACRRRRFAPTYKRGCPALPGCSGWARKLGAPAASSNKARLLAACWLLDCTATIGCVHTKFRMSEALISIYFFPFVPFKSDFTAIFSSRNRLCTLTHPCYWTGHRHATTHNSPYACRWYSGRSLALWSSDVLMPVRHCRWRV
jgi:hypothetical protein